MNRLPKIIMMLCAATAVAGGIWTADWTVGTNTVIEASPGSQFRLVDAYAASNTTVSVSYVSARTNEYAVGSISGGKLGAAVPPVGSGARLVLRATATDTPVLAVIEGGDAIVR